MRCPHTMKATDRNGVTVCRDCGEIMPPRKAKPKNT